MKGGAGGALAVMVAGVLAATAALGSLRVLLPDPVTTRVEHTLLDLRFRLRGPRPAPPDIIIVAIDEAALIRFPDPEAVRGALAQAVGALHADGAASIAIDLLLLAPSPADALLARALADAAPVALATALSAEAPASTPSPSPDAGDAAARSLIPLIVSAPAGSRTVAAEAGALFAGVPMLPQPSLAATARLGHVNIPRAADRVAREMLAAVPIGTGPERGYLPALPVVAVDRAGRLGPGALALWPGEWLRIGERVIPTGPSGEITLNHYGSAGTIPAIGLADLVAGQVPAGTFRDRIVFVGATAETLRDVFATPFGATVAGVEVLATFAGNLIDASMIRRDGATGAMTLGLALVASALAVAAALPAHPALGIAASVAVWLGAAAGVVVAFTTAGLWLDAVSVAGGLALGSGAGAFLRDRAARVGATRLRHEKARIARFVPAGLAQALAEAPNPAFDRRMQDAAVLFVDVAGYTARSEHETPLAVAEFLARLHTAIEDAATASGGVIVDFLGDGAMIVFGLPDPAPGDAAAAIACGEALVAAAARLGGGDAGTAPVRLRVSVHFGPVAAAILGGRRHAHATVTGDTVNLASRLQDTAKRHDADFVASGAALAAAGRLVNGHAPGFAPLGRETPRGRRQSVEVWSYRRPAIRS